MGSQRRFRGFLAEAPGSVPSAKRGLAQVGAAVHFGEHVGVVNSLFGYRFAGHGWTRESVQLAVPVHDARAIEAARSRGLKNVQCLGVHEFVRRANLGGLKFTFITAFDGRYRRVTTVLEGARASWLHLPQRDEPRQQLEQAERARGAEPDQPDIK